MLLLQAVIFIINRSIIRFICSKLKMCTFVLNEPVNQLAALHQSATRPTCPGGFNTVLDRCQRGKNFTPAITSTASRLSSNGAM